MQIKIFVKKSLFHFVGRRRRRRSSCWTTSSPLLRIMPEFVRDYLKASSPPFFLSPPFPPPHPAMATKPLPERKRSMYWQRRKESLLKARWSDQTCKFLGVAFMKFPNIKVYELYFCLWRKRPSEGGRKSESRTKNLVFPFPPLPSPEAAAAAF